MEFKHQGFREYVVRSEKAFSGPVSGVDALEHPDVREMFDLILTALRPFVDARVAVADAIAAHRDALLAKEAGQGPNLRYGSY